MRQTYYFLSFVLLLFVFISCSNDVVGKGTDTIGLETKEVFFKSSKDSIELRTRKGDDWWLTEISTKDTIYRTHSLNVQVIEGGGLYVEKTGRKSIFIRIPSDSTSRWTPLPLAIYFPLSGRFRDLHPLEYVRAGRTK